MSRRILVAVTLFILGSVATAHAEDWANTKRACQDWQKAPRQYHSLEECLIDFFTLEPLAVTAGSIGSGSGVAVGARVLKQYNPHGLETTFTAKSLYSLNSFYLMSGQYTLQLPKPKFVSGDLAPLIDVVASRVDLRTQNFYGLGPTSTLAGLAVYREQLDTVGVDGYTPVSSWAGFGADFHYLNPRVKGVSNTSTPSVVDIYGDVGAPGSIDNASFIEAGVNFGFQKSALQTWLPWEHHSGVVEFQHYSQLGSKQHSFGQLSAMANVTVTPVVHLHEDIQQEMNRTHWQDFLCFAQVGKVCHWGTFSTTGLVTTSYTGTTSTVPFYFQPTLGGTDVDGTETLRGLADYRLRAPNRLLIQEDFDKTLLNLNWKSPRGDTYGLGQYGLYLFFDAGNVALNPSSLSMGNLRTDAGIGLSVAIGTKILGRIYLGFGAGEGTQFNAKLPSAFSSTPK
jgi:hypothetical protein